MFARMRCEISWATSSLGQDIRPQVLNKRAHDKPAQWACVVFDMCAMERHVCHGGVDVGLQDLSKQVA
eukprot:3377558-Amphidinium_carterae.2